MRSKITLNRWEEETREAIRQHIDSEKSHLRTGIESPFLVLICDPRRNQLLSEGSKGDRPEARRLAEQYGPECRKSVYHEHGATLNLKELVRGYETLSIDTIRTMIRIKAIYRGRGIRTPCHVVYQPKQREQWLGSWLRLECSSARAGYTKSWISCVNSGAGRNRQG